MTGKCEAKMNDDHTAVYCNLVWRVDVENQTGNGLTEAQCKALIDYCKRMIPICIAGSEIDASVSVTPCKIYRNAQNHALSRIGLLYYDADTGELYDERDICDGQHEIRIKPTDSPKTT